MWELHITYIYKATHDFFFFKPRYIENFDSSKGLPEMWKNKMHILNKHSVSLLQLLKDPKSMLLIFKTEREASLCLKSLFPNPALIETKKMRICIQVMPFNEISMKFQSTLDASRSFPAKSLEVIPRLHLLAGIFHPSCCILDWKRVS